MKPRVLTRLACQPPRRVLLNVIKRDLKRGGHGHSISPSSPPPASYTLVCGSQEVESNSLLEFPGFTITA